MLAALARAHLRELGVPALELSALAAGAGSDVAGVAAGLAFRRGGRLRRAMKTGLHRYSFSLTAVIGTRGETEKP
jgi:hypothetical protein